MIAFLVKPIIRLNKDGVKEGVCNVILLGFLIKKKNNFDESAECAESNDENECTSCSSERNFTSGQCLCNDGTYEN